MAKGDKVSLVAVPDMVPLATEVCQLMRAGGFKKLRDVIPVKINHFADGVSLAQITQSIRRTEVYLFYAPPIGQPDLGLAELAKILNATHFGSPRSIKVVLPNFWEGRADRKSNARESTNAKELAKIIESYSSVDGMFTFDLHAEQIVLAFDRVAVDDLKGRVILAEHVRKLFPDLSIVELISPDVGSAKRTRKLAKRLGKKLAGIVDKERTGDNIAEMENFIGKVPVGKTVIIADDIFDTGSTLFNAAEYLLKQGVAKVLAVGTHGHFNPDKKTRKSFAERSRALGISVIVLDTIPRTPDFQKENADWLTIVSSAPMFTHAIIASLTPGASVSKLSEDEK
ncbi:MAG: hypothetical protein A3D65_04270 [Candidatus Lloydbacteria bacterium RIFCSPHIGHO2_02_FULL_50_13]|uniref:ribose-phosphate diphosphokinase n=1 Tax=Candidatus Lloydbacteria bacterium RIFCSPHIGHO2_02_FULL_50_13 TaxID=1798661 RepID=A0A1G2D4J2_9BACT|nr:MAG: hypothetical protein A3D65_04270 [Candidatus Lloydbacteria bacterium RIFCSPHIGHO2_02_FULL_50_13]